MSITQEGTLVMAHNSQISLMNSMLHRTTTSGERLRKGGEAASANTDGWQEILVVRWVLFWLFCKYVNKEDKTPGNFLSEGEQKPITQRNEEFLWQTVPRSPADWAAPCSCPSLARVANHKDVQVTACFSSARKDRITHCQHEKLVETSHLHVPLLSKHDPDSY